MQSFEYLFDLAWSIAEASKSSTLESHLILQCKIQFCRSFDRQKHHIISSLIQTEAWNQADSLSAVLQILNKNSRDENVARSVGSNAQAMDTSNIVTSNSQEADINHINTRNFRGRGRGRGGRGGRSNFRRGSNNNSRNSRGRGRTRSNYKSCLSCNKYCPEWCQFCSSCVNKT